MVSLLKGLAGEKIVLLSSLAKMPFALEGIVRLVDKKGHNLGLFLDREVLEAIEEEVESARPEFLASLETSRRSGKISSKEIKKKIGLK